jgi:hypothetical protein
LLRGYLVAHGVTHAPAPADIDLDGDEADGAREEGTKSPHEGTPT